MYHGLTGGRQRGFRDKIGFVLIKRRMPGAASLMVRPLLHYRPPFDVPMTFMAARPGLEDLVKLLVDAA